MPKNIKDYLRKNKHLIFLVSQSSARWYIKEGTPIESFFLEFKKLEVEYVVLRWWRKLPNVEKGEDIDILIEDNSFNKIKHLITKKNQGQALDIYTVHGLKEGKYGSISIPYYPQKLADNILSNRVLYKDIYFVPNDEYYFYSLAYHAIFHKGVNSGIEGFNLKAFKEPEHNYEEVLNNLAKKASIVVDITLSNIINILERKKYTPSVDLLTKLNDLEPSLQQLLPRKKCNIKGGEMSLLIIRERAIQDNYLDELKRIITINFSMDIVMEFSLNIEQREYLRTEMRGGDWGNGFSYGLSGGLPSVILVVFDYHCKPLSKKYQVNYTNFTNQNLIDCKHKMREYIHSRTLSMYHYNSTHSTDNEYEAGFFLDKLLDKKSHQKLLANIDAIRNSYHTTYNVIKLVSYNSRSKVEVVDYKEHLAIKKTFRLHSKKFLKKEIFGHDILSESIKKIPKLLKKEECYLITKYYEEITDLNIKYKILKDNKSIIIDFIYSLYNLGYAHINITPGNILVTKDKLLFLIDFEFLYEYKNKPNDILQSYDIVPVPNNFDGDLPIGYNEVYNSYKCQWKKIIGNFILNDNKNTKE